VTFMESTKNRFITFHFSFRLSQDMYAKNCMTDSSMTHSTNNDSVPFEHQHTGELRREKEFDLLRFVSFRFISFHFDSI
jgi:hypothetical protein